MVPIRARLPKRGCISSCEHWQCATVSVYMGNVITSILETLGIGGAKGDSVIGIDIGSSAIKVVQLKRAKGAAVLETYGEIALGPYADGAVGQASRTSFGQLTEALNDVMREANITTKQSGIAIPFSQSLTNVIEVPSSAEGRLDEMVPLEARKYVPVPVSEVTIDWFKLPRQQQGNADQTQGAERIEVLLVAIHNNVLETYHSLAQELSLEPAFFEVEAFSTVRSVVGQQVAPVLLIDIGAASTKVFVIERGVVRESHTINAGGQDVTRRYAQRTNVSFATAERHKRDAGLDASGEQAKEIVEAAMLTTNSIFSESRRVLLNYQKRTNAAVDHVVLSGGGALLSGIRERAEEEFGLPVERAAPFEKTQTPAFLQDTLAEAGPTFAVAIGLALRHLRDIG